MSTPYGVLHTHYTYMHTNELQVPDALARVAVQARHAWLACRTRQRPFLRPRVSDLPADHADSETKAKTTDGNMTLERRKTTRHVLPCTGCDSQPTGYRTWQPRGCCSPPFFNPLSFCLMSCWAKIKGNDRMHCIMHALASGFGAPHCTLSMSVAFFAAA